MTFERKYSDEVRREAIASVVERRERFPDDRSIIRTVASEFGVGEQSLRLWLKQRNGAAGGASRRESSDAAVVRLQAEVEELTARIDALTEENYILKKAFKIITAE